jgi:hypothetical protein
LRRFELLQGEIDQQLQLQNRQLPPVRVLVKLDADQGDDVGVIIQLAVFQALQQRFQAGIVEAVQVQDVGAEGSALLVLSQIRSSTG